MHINLLKFKHLVWSLENVYFIGFRFIGSTQFLFFGKNMGRNVKNIIIDFYCRTKQFCLPKLLCPKFHTSLMIYFNIYCII